jgi:hypothetical protein
MVDAYDQLREENTWPRSYELYEGSIKFQVAAQNEEQARRRLDQLNTFLNGLFLDPRTLDAGPHEAVLYCMPMDSEKELRHTDTVTVQSLDEVRPGMASGIVPSWYWLLPDADKDYDPEDAAHRVHFSEYDESEWE